MLIVSYLYLIFGTQSHVSVPWGYGQPQSRQTLEAHKWLLKQANLLPSSDDPTGLLTWDTLPSGSTTLKETWLAKRLKYCDIYLEEQTHMIAISSEKLSQTGVTLAPHFPPARVHGWLIDFVQDFTHKWPFWWSVSYITLKEGLLKVNFKNQMLGKKLYSRVGSNTR